MKMKCQHRFFHKSQNEERKNIYSLVIIKYTIEKKVQFVKCKNRHSKSNQQKKNRKKFKTIIAFVKWFDKMIIYEKQFR